MRSLRPSREKTLMDPSSLTSQTPAPQMFNFMQVPSAPPPWAILQEVEEPNPRSSAQIMKDILKVKLEEFWSDQSYEINRHKPAEVYKQHALPLARIRRVMKSDDEVKMVSADTPVLFAKACELFISELAIRSFLKTEDQIRLTIRRCDIANAIYDTEEFDFLREVVPPETRDHGVDGEFLEANLVSLSHILDARQFDVPQEPPVPANYIISDPPALL